MSTEGAVIDTVNRFHLCVDRRDWTAARSCLADVVHVSPDGGKSAQQLPAEEFLSSIRGNVESFSATQHLVAGHHVQLEAGATARCQASFQSHHASAAGRWVLAGRQDLRLRRSRGAWQIIAVTLHPAWEDGEPPRHDTNRPGQP